MCRTRCRGPRTPSITTEANLDCAATPGVGFVQDRGPEEGTVAALDTAVDHAPRTDRGRDPRTEAGLATNSIFL